MIDKKYRTNLEEFWEKHGARGFLKLYFAKYLFNIAMSQIKARSEGESIDIGLEFYLKDEKLVSLRENQKYEKEIYEECKIIADSFVKDLEKDKTFSSILNEKAVDKFFSEKEKLFKIFERKFRKSIQKLSEENEK